MAGRELEVQCRGGGIGGQDEKYCVCLPALRQGDKLLEQSVNLKAQVDKMLLNT